MDRNGYRHLVSTILCPEAYLIRRDVVLEVRLSMRISESEPTFKLLFYGMKI